MKISYRHLINSITEKPTIEEVSAKLFQLGHENEIFDDILDIRILSIELAACKLVKAGHKIISIKNKKFKMIDIVSQSNNQYYVFKLYNDSKENLDIMKNQIVNECKTMLLENNITSSINISVISVQFSKDKPKITFKDIS